MKIIGCDFHPGYQQIVLWDQASGEMQEKSLSHEGKEEVRAFYAGLEGPVRVGIEASGQSQWFERMLAELEGIIDHSNRYRRNTNGNWDGEPINEVELAAFARRALDIIHV